ncbi:MAG: hypothetical protein R3C18_04510 [Planctomycetaceae bacterium]
MSTDASPADPNATIWRFVEFWKFEDLLKTFSDQSRWQTYPENTNFHQPSGQFWFSYPFAFEDTYEGVFTAKNSDPETFCDEQAKLQQLSSSEAKKRKLKFLCEDTKSRRDAISILAQICGVSCWHQNEEESRQMWQHLFEDSPDALAIKSTVGNVEGALGAATGVPNSQKKIAITKVGYVNYGDYFMKRDGYFDLLCFIREGLELENEVRFLAHSAHFNELFDGGVDQLETQPDMSGITQRAEEIWLQNQQDKIEGFHLPVDLAAMDMEVVLSPTASDETLSKIRSMLKNVNLSPDVVRKSQY